MFERFTKAARETVTNAVAIAGERGDHAIGNEHLLAGVAATDSPTATLLESLGASSDRLRTAISELDTSALAAIGINADALHIGPATPNEIRSEWQRKQGHIPFTGAAKRTLQGALREAIGRKDRFIGSEHILAAITSTGNEDPARRILAGLDIDVVSLREAALRRS
jgi:ATP-dependent Clp protease ATP-binding subunit ClpA